jgi:excisionase family DNA binding protein
MTERWLTTTEVSDRLGWLSPDTVRRMCEEGRFDGALQRAPGKPWRIPESALERYLEGRTWRAEGE